MRGDFEGRIDLVRIGGVNIGMDSSITLNGPRTDGPLTTVDGWQLTAGLLFPCQ
jgi:hypothetical protein